MRFWSIVLFLCAVSVSWVFAQDVCPQVAQTALQSTSTACEITQRNEACYGNVAISANLTPTTRAKFEQVGDIVTLADVETITLAPLNEEEGTWGVALLRVQASLPDTLPGQNVTMLLFGDVSFSPIPDEEQSPQAFYFTAGIGDAPCKELPESGVLIQSPKGVGKVELSLNGVDISLGSTLYVQAQPSDQMVIALLDGNATLTVDDVSLTLESGFQTSIALDDNGTASGDFAAPTSIDVEKIAPLPLSLLPEALERATATTAATVNATDINGTWSITATSGTESNGCPPGTINAFIAGLSGDLAVFRANADATAFNIGTFNDSGLLEDFILQSDGTYSVTQEPTTANFGVAITSTVTFTDATTLALYYEATFDLSGNGTLCTVTLDAIGTKQ